MPVKLVQYLTYAYSYYLTVALSLVPPTPTISHTQLAHLENTSLVNKMVLEYVEK